MEELPSAQELTVRVQPPLDSKVVELMRMHAHAQDGSGWHVSRPIDIVLLLYSGRNQSCDDDASFHVTVRH
jgi:hypothetical protein